MVINISDVTIRNQTNPIFPPDNVTQYPWYQSSVALFIYTVIVLMCMCGCPYTTSKNRKVVQV